MGKLQFFNRKKKALLVLICGVPLLNACGGGGDDSGNPSAAELAAPVAINESNQQLVASAALSSGDVDAALDFSSGVQAQAASSQPTLSLKDLAKLQMDLVNARQNNGTVLPASAQSSSQACPAGGSMTISPVEGSSSNDPRGSGADISYSNCQFSTDFILNGSSSVRLADFTENYLTGAYPYSVKMTMSFTKLAVTFAQDTSTLNGNLNYDMSAPDADNMEMGLSGNQFSINYNNVENNTLNDFAFNIKANLLLSQTSTTQKGRLFSDVLKGYMDFDTLDPFLSQFGDFPTKGKLKIVGANSTLFVTAQSDGQYAMLELDSGNDGTINQMTPVLWSDLE